MLQTNYLRENFELIDVQGWALMDLPTDFCQSLLSSAKNRFQQNQFKEAVVTTDLTSNKQTPDPENTIRSDMTCWLDEKNAQGPEILVLDFLNTLQNELTQFFRFSLTHYECHYAVYQPGRFYKKHSDQTKKDNHRYFSFVIYLNENWLPENGGQLIGYKNDDVAFQIQPHLGKMVVFKSDIEHEVYPATASRWSLTGWFRK